MKILKRVLVALLIIFILLLIVILVAFINLKHKTNKILDDYSNIYSSEIYKESFLIDNVQVFEQNVSCGYAVIEMFAKWNNDQNITEKSLFDKYGKVVTSTGKSFEQEMNKEFPNYKTTMYKYLKSSELIDKVYISLSKGIPVPFEWAAKYKGEWTLHYSLVIGIDIPNDKITIANPYGYIEEISIKEFINRTSFESFENMPAFLKLGFAFGIFEKNTIFIADKINDTKENNVNMTDAKVIINNKTYTLTLENNKTVEEFLNLLPQEFTMTELNGNEKYVYMNNTLATNSYNPKHIEKGDVMLYGNNCLVIFYKSFDTSYSYTKIGHIDNLENLGKGNIIAKFEK